MEEVVEIKFPRYILTAGYGNLSPEKFVALLNGAGVTVVLDIRRKGCKSWNFYYNQGTDFEVFLEAMGDGIVYWDYSIFANRDDTLRCYKAWLDSSHMCESVALLAGTISCIPASAFCLICSEGKPFEADGVTPRCHRVYVAEALVKELGEGWEVKHL